MHTHYTLTAFTWTLLIRLEVEEQLNRTLKNDHIYASIGLQFSDRNLILCGIEEVV